MGTCANVVGGGMVGARSIDSVAGVMMEEIGINLHECGQLVAPGQE